MRNSTQIANSHDFDFNKPQISNSLENNLLFQKKVMLNGMQVYDLDVELIIKKMKELMERLDHAF